MTGDVSRETSDPKPEKRISRALAYAEAQAASEHRLAERSEQGRKAAQRRVRELEAVLKDARIWMAQNGTEGVPTELRRILNRPEGRVGYPDRTVAGVAG